MPSLRALFAMLLVGAGTACTDLLAPSAEGLAGLWRLGPVQGNPSGEYLRTLEFTADRRYVATARARGIYPQLPADSVSSISRTYGTWALDADTLRLAQDSVRSWDYLGGSYFRAGPEGPYIEGPPTDPVVELTSTRLTLRYMVDPGAGYVPVTDRYVRDR